MFKAVTDLKQIHEYGQAGLLWDSWFIRDSDTSKYTYGSMVWDDPQPIQADQWDPAMYYLDDPHTKPEASSLYKFYIYLED